MTILRANGKILKANGKVLVKPDSAIPEILFASDDFVDIHAGELLSSNVESADSSNFAMPYGSNTPFGDGVFNTMAIKSEWNASKKFCLFSDKNVVIKAPITKLDVFSLQFYYMSDQDGGRFHFFDPYTEIFSVYNDATYVTLLALGGNAEAFNTAGIGTGPWQTNPTKCSYSFGGHAIVTFISVVCKRISGNTFRLYFYANGVLYFAFNKSLSTDNIPISHAKHSASSTKKCYLSEIMLFSYSRASQDMRTYPTNNYEPMF
jgi:hypothetical protein